MSIEVFILPLFFPHRSPGSPKEALSSFVVLSSIFRNSRERRKGATRMRPAPSPLSRRPPLHAHPPPPPRRFGRYLLPPITGLCETTNFEVKIAHSVRAVEGVGRWSADGRQAGRCCLASRGGGVRCRVRVGSSLPEVCRNLGAARPGASLPLDQVHVLKEGRS